jgi:hypothetical protein
MYRNQGAPSTSLFYLPEAITSRFERSGIIGNEETNSRGTRTLKRFELIIVIVDLSPEAL